MEISQQKNSVGESFPSKPFLSKSFLSKPYRESNVEETRDHRVNKNP